MQDKTQLMKELCEEACRVVLHTTTSPKLAMPLTKRQQEVLDFIIAYKAKHYIAPTYDEIGNAMGISRPSVFGQVTALEMKGHIRRIPGHHRTIEIAAVSDRRDMGRLRELAHEYARVKVG